MNEGGGTIENCSEGMERRDRKKQKTSLLLLLLNRDPDEVRGRGREAIK